MRRIINAVAPIRVADLGGWTDTWFAERGVVCNIAVYPYAEVQISVTEDHDGSEPRIAVHAENFGERYIILPGVLNMTDTPLSMRVSTSWNCRRP